MSTTVIARKPAGDTFLASRFNLRLVRSPVKTIRNPSDGTVIDKTAPDRIEFSGGTYRATDADTAEWLRRHPLFGDSRDGFRELEIAAPEPSSEELDAILAAAGDVKQLQRLLDDEKANWNRGKVVDLLEGQIARQTPSKAA